VTNVRYYDGLEVRPDREVDAETARTASTSAHAVFGADDRLERVELYDGGRLFRVDYQDADGEAIAAAHQQAYEGVPYATRRTIPREGALSWEAVYGYGASGDLQDCTLVLQDEDARARMEVKREADGAVREVTKYVWEGGRLTHVFSYDPSGELFDVADLEDGGTVRFDDLRPYLDDPDFYADGLALPRDLAGGAIPDCP
jgi:hypothetical protein